MLYRIGYNVKEANKINVYYDQWGNSPYAEWLASMRDARAKARIMMQVDRMELGLFGDSAPIGEGLSELRIHFGPGYRVYYGKEQSNEYLILCGGDKSTQTKDIQRAKGYWRDHKGRTKDET